MVIIEHEQGSDEWYQCKLGRASASNFSQIMQPVRLKPALTKYIYQLSAERRTGMGQEPEWEGYYIKRGKELEECARAAYEWKNNVEVKQVGFCLATDNGGYGCSPDGLVGDDGGVEIKCPALTTHLEYMHLKTIPSKYLSQIYGCLWIMQRKWWDFMSYHPDEEEVIIRVSCEDEKYKKWCVAFRPILKDFLTEVNNLAKCEPPFKC